MHRAPGIDILAGLALFFAGGEEGGGERVPGGGSEDWQ